VVNKILRENKVGSKWEFKIKELADGSFEKFKARIIV
jgi:hypothetical protein